MGVQRAAGAIVRVVEVGDEFIVVSARVMLSLGCNIESALYLPAVYGGDPPTMQVTPSTMGGTPSTVEVTPSTMEVIVDDDVPPRWCP